MDVACVKRTILIADDAEPNRLLLKKIFGQDFHIEEAVDGLETLEKLRELSDIAVLILDIMMPKMDGFAVLEAMQKDECLRTIPTVVVTASNEEDIQIRALSGGATDVMTKPFSSQIILHRIKNIMARREAEKLAEQNRAYKRELRLMHTDEKSGLFNKNAFHHYTAKMLYQNPEKKFVLFRWDIDNFKVFNDWFGTDAGDAYLKKIGDFYRASNDDEGELMTYARYDADHFVCCKEAEGFDHEMITENIDAYVGQLNDLDFEYTPRVGIYMISDPTLDVALMCDRALLALRSIKHSYGKRYAWFDDSMRESLIEQQEIVNEMEFALKQGQFTPYLQPQYNYDSGRLVGAEALVRWHHPTKGNIFPNKFIPLFESNGFISKLDEYVWEQICILLKKWQDNGMPKIPISVNVSRRDIYNPHLVGNILALLRKYDLEPSLLHLEITESAYTQNAEQVIHTVNLLRKHGFEVHMDDFGSGYSSLNMLKNVPVDILKLDMKFLGGDYKDERSGNILNAVIRMAAALHIPVLAEGVETKEQADFLRSIGCLLMQGYFFAKPIPIPEFEQLLMNANTTSILEDTFLKSVEGSVNFLSLTAQSALLFNSFVGGAAVMEYDQRNRTLVALRINDQFLKEIGITRTEYMDRGQSIFDYYENENKEIFRSMLDKAIETGTEASCEVVSRVSKLGKEYKWLKLRSKLLATASNKYILYLSVDNITKSKERMLACEKTVQSLTTFMDHAPGGAVVFEVTDQTKLLYCNHRMAELFGYTHKEFVQAFAGKFVAAVHPEDQEKVEKVFDLAFQRERTVEMIKYRQICKDGSWQWAHMVSRQMKSEEKQGYVCSFVMASLEEA